MAGDGKDEESGKLLYCSFCGKNQHEVRKLIAGPSVFICDECVELCNDIIREEVSESKEEKEQLSHFKAILVLKSNEFNAVFDPQCR